MPLTTLNDMEIYYELHGKGEPLVLISGYTCDHTVWTAMLDQLKQYFQVLIFDNRGIGQTKDHGRSFSLHTMAEDTFALIEKLGLKKPHLLGQSMGGAIIQEMAKKHANQLGKIIILNSVAKFNMNTLLAMQTVLQLRRENMPIDLVMNAILPWVFSSDYLTPENIALFKRAVINNPYPQSLPDQERQYHALAEFDSSAWCHHIDIPALVIASENDLMVLPKESEWLATQLPQASFVTIPGGHSSLVEQPRSLTKLIINFLTENE